ncbi:MarC family protein [Herbiconiux solani]|uniref:MarC family protein n=1 Tax=Herbiconiux solani TaxID=661329 RepID=UPI0012EDA009|nr:MarC family protein [Herbiconiux solani]
MISAPTIMTSAIALLTIANPIGSLPIFLNLTKDFDRARQRRIGILVGIAVFAVLTVSLLLGKLILEAFSIDITSFRIAGNLLVASIGWGMLTAKANVLTVSDSQSPVVVPLAIPLIAGPGAISLVITFAENYGTPLDLLAGVLVNLGIALVIAVALFFAPEVARVVKPTGMSIVTRIFGLLLLSIAVQSILGALTTVFPVLTK